MKWVIPMISCGRLLADEYFVFHKFWKNIHYCINSANVHFHLNVQTSLWAFSDFHPNKFEVYKKEIINQAISVAIRFYGFDDEHCTLTTYYCSIFEWFIKQNSPFRIECSIIINKIVYVLITKHENFIEEA